MGDDRKSQGSANWRLTSLWRPLSGSALGSSSHVSLQEIFSPHFSLSIPSLFLGRQSASRDLAIENGTSSLLEETSEKNSRRNTAYSQRSDVIKSPGAESFESAQEQIDDIRPGSSKEASPVQNLDQRPYPRRLSRASAKSGITKRPESRDTTFLAELPAIPPRLRTIRSSRPTIVDIPAQSHAEHRDSCPPPVPAKPSKAMTKASSAQDSDPHLVLWNGLRDPEKAMNWSTSRKCTSTLVLSFVTFCVAFASSITVPANGPSAEQFGVSSKVMTLVTSLFMLGLALGPFIWSPLNERHGHKLPLFIGLAGFAIFQIPAAVASNLETLLVSRFLSGVFGCSPLIAAVASLTELWEPLGRGTGLSVFTASLFIGTASGPLVGAPVVQSTVLGRRWTSWVILILCFPFGMACGLLFRESSPPVLLHRRARVLRYSTNNWALHAPSDEIQLTWRTILTKHIWMPILMLLTDPVLLSMTAHMSFAYGIMYLMLEFYTMSFFQDRHWPLELSGLPFLAVIGGVVLGLLVDLLFTKKRFAALVKKYGRLCPEERLLPMIVGAIALPMGLFISAWTSSRHISPVGEIAAGVPLGIGFHLVFLQGNNYLVEVFGTNANSAIVINTSIRSLIAAAFTGFARCMYEDLEPQWALTVLGVLSCVLVPIPVVCYKYGVRLRAASRFTPKLPSGSGTSPVEGFAETKE